MPPTAARSSALPATTELLGASVLVPVELADDCTVAEEFRELFDDWLELADDC